jgi:hypothetical protein
MNGRPLLAISSTAEPAATPTEILLPPQESTARPYLAPIHVIVILFISIVIAFVLVRRRGSGIG